MKSSYTSVFNQQQKIQQQISKKYGYSITSNPLTTSKISHSIPKQTYINHSFKPLQVQKMKPELSEQHKKLLEQIKEKQHEKRMKKLCEQNNQTQLNIIKLMNQKVKQYNFVIDHKHIAQQTAEYKNKLIEKSLLELEQQQKMQSILLQINTKNKQLSKLSEFNQHQQMNKTITNLFKKYKQAMSEQKSQKDKKRMTNTTSFKSTHYSDKKKFRTFSLTEKINSKYQSKIVMHKMPSMIYSNIKNTHIQHHYHRQHQQRVLNIPNMEQSDRNLEEPFFNVDKTTEMQKKDELTTEVLEKCRRTITNMNNLLQLKQHQKAHQNNTSIKNQLRQSFNSYTNQFSDILQRTQSIESRQNKPNIVQIQKNKKKQQKYLSNYLQKRNCKFKKPWGNKILIKYSGEFQAKQMLEGTPSSTIMSRQSTQYIQSHNTSMVLTSNKNTKTPNTISFQIIPHELSEDDQLIMESIQQQKQDLSLKQTKRRNQKINLFLKSKRKAKY